MEVAHVHHGFRGEESDSELVYVQEYCEKQGIVCHVGRFDVPQLRKEWHLSAQEAARRVRHTFLHETAEAIQAQLIALAHTQTDRIETILLQILRGTGTQGLGGFPAKNLPLVRPLFDITREETQAYCTEQNLKPRTDSSNQNTAYRRNRTRLELLPYLREHYNPAVEDALLRLAEIATEDNNYLEAQAKEAWKGVVEKNSQTILREPFLALHPAMQRRVLRLAMAQARQTEVDLSFEMVEQVRLAVLADTPLTLQLPDAGTRKTSIQYRESRVFLEVEAPFRTPEAWQKEITPILIEEGEPLLEAEFQALLPAHEVKLPLVVRSWRKGDRMRPHGMQGHKKLQDLFTDAKIPRDLRSTFSVLVDEGGEGRVWGVLGLRLAEGAIHPTQDLPTHAPQPLYAIRIETALP
jgi:tRNA(Ile)-lysidine synthase